VCEPVAIKAGDFYLLANGMPYRTATDLSQTSQDEQKVFETRLGPDGIVRVGTVSVNAVVAGGRFRLDEETSGLLLEQLPHQIHIPAGSLGTLALTSVRQLMELEIDASGYGASVVQSNLATMILVLLLRAYLTSHPKPPGWLGALSNPKIDASLTRINNDISLNWQLRKLTSEAGMSRTAFVERFKRVVGVPPLVYLIP
jgi:hypothetical protein